MNFISAVILLIIIDFHLNFKIININDKYDKMYHDIKILYIN